MTSPPDQQPKALIFDLDGTLVDTVQTRIAAWLQTFEEFGIPADRRQVSKLIGSDGRRLARVVAEAAGKTIDAALAEEIDRRGLTHARQEAMRIAVAGLGVAAEYLLVDAWDVPDLPLPQLCVVKGDSICASIMAASILAKVYRDRLMIEYDRQFPGYGFAVHKGYATRAHQQALRALGPSPIHRMSWAPIRAVLAANGT